MNQTKRTLEIVAAVLGIIVGTLLLFGGILLLPQIMDVLENASGDEKVAAQILLITTIFIILLSISVVVLCGFLCRSPKAKNGVYPTNIGFDVAVAVLLLFIAISEIVGGQIVYGLLALAPAVLAIVGACLKHDRVPEESSIYISATPGFDGKENHGGAIHGGFEDAKEVPSDLAEPKHIDE